MLGGAEAGMRSCCVAVSVLSIALLSQTTYAQAPPKAQPPTRAKAPATRPVPRPLPPLDAKRTAYVDDRSGAAGALEHLQKGLRERHLWKLTATRDAADLIVTLAPLPTVQTPGRPNQPAQQQRLSSYELTIRSARNPAIPPLWRSVSSSPDKLVSRLKADLAPSLCVVVWCR
jgi:hypothetical protein